MKNFRILCSSILLGFMMLSISAQITNPGQPIPADPKIKIGKLETAINIKSDFFFQISEIAACFFFIQQVTVKTAERTKRTAEWNVDIQRRPIVPPCFSRRYYRLRHIRTQLQEFPAFATGDPPGKSGGVYRKSIICHFSRRRLISFFSRWCPGQYLQWKHRFRVDCPGFRRRV